MFIDIMHITCIIYIIYFILKCFPRYVVILCTQWWEVEGSLRGMPPSITAKYIRETLASSAITPFCQFCLINLLGFCLNITHIALRAWTFRNCPQTEVTLMCTEHFLMIRYNPTVILCTLPSPDHSCAEITSYQYYNNYFIYYIFLQIESHVQYITYFPFHSIHLGLAVSIPFNGCVGLCSSPEGENNLLQGKRLKYIFCSVSYYTHYTFYTHYFAG